MKSLRSTVMFYVTILLVAVSVAAAVTSYYFVKYEVNSFQDNALQEVALTAGLLFRNDIQPRIASLKGKVDLVYAPASNLMAQASSAVVAARPIEGLRRAKWVAYVIPAIT